MEKLSVFVTTFNNARTLRACLESVKWANEIVLLDSYSTDTTLAIAREFGCHIHQHHFLGYGKQKQMALDKTSYRWVLLLDADEALSAALQKQVQQVLRDGPAADGYEMPRQEQMFWRMADTRVRMNYFLRFFDKTKGRMSDMPIHAAPKVIGTLRQLHAPFYHYGEISVYEKVEKLNAYSTGLVADKLAQGRRANPWIMVVYPPLFFLRIYFLKRNFLNGWAGFIASVSSAFYVFLKYAKLYEHAQRSRHGDALLPPGAPPSYVKE